VGGRPLPTTGAQRVALGGHRGAYLPALGYEPQCGSQNRSGFWCNHAVFVWREQGLEYAATLHFFGASETRSLLGRLVAELAPIR
jgi:hypothetical protein